MLAHQKLFLMMHNNFVQKKPTKIQKKNISVIRFHDVVIGSHVKTSNRQKEKVRLS
jgi:hypothetical protein